MAMDRNLTELISGQYHPTTRVVNLVPRLLVKVQTKPENACFLSDIELQSLVNERPV